MQQSGSRPNYPPLRIGSRFPFKKYRGKRTGEVIVEDPRYVRWCIDNTSLELDNEAYRVLVEIERDEDSYQNQLPSERFEERF